MTKEMEKVLRQIWTPWYRRVFSFGFKKAMNVILTGMVVYSFHIIATQGNYWLILVIAVCLFLICLLHME